MRKYKLWKRQQRIRIDVRKSKSRSRLYVYTWHPTKKTPPSSFSYSWDDRGWEGRLKERQQDEMLKHNERYPVLVHHPSHHHHQASPRCIHSTSEFLFSSFSIQHKRVATISINERQQLFSMPMWGISPECVASSPAHTFHSFALNLISPHKPHQDFSQCRQLSHRRESESKYPNWIWRGKRRLKNRISHMSIMRTMNERLNSPNTR